MVHTHTHLEPSC